MCDVISQKLLSTCDNGIARYLYAMLFVSLPTLTSILVMQYYYMNKF